MLLKGKRLNSRTATIPYGCSNLATRMSVSPPGLFGREHHQHLAAFHARVRLDLGDIAGLLLHPAEHCHAKLAMRHFAAAEAHGDLHLVAFLQELEHLL